MYENFRKSKMNMNKEYILKYLNALGFRLKSGEDGVHYKKYKGINNYEISIKLSEVNVKRSKINYGNLITVSRETTTSFQKNENLVVLECVNRLLEKGYRPEKIVLEKEWKVGHREKGILDIQVLDQNEESFLMIECKTFGGEFHKEMENIYKDGGQLFSYYTQEKSTKYLCLYTSEIAERGIEYKSNIIKINDKIKKAKNRIEAYESWKPQIIEQRGIFEEGVGPYNVEFMRLKKSDLRPLTKEDGGDIFNRFAEILRRNVISDKSNAYNKIFNLFLCKIVDESEASEEEDLKFQWAEGETNEDVLLRLNALYKSGMNHYLNLEISAVDIEEFDEHINSIETEGDKRKIKDLFIKQKLYSSNDFAFKEVFDKNTFNLNCEVVKEVVKLLESFKIKYETKQQFLGDFFEKLLNTGIKQEVGQYFTPVPIAQFICKSLPFKNIVERKIQDKEYNILPYIIDYASGAGHFITESMEEVDSIIKAVDEEGIKNQRAKGKFRQIKDNFDFAREYVYGIEKDYRLAKTTKVATYLNGDGDAQIICGDGLDSFSKSKDYKGVLKLSQTQKENGRFDVVVANPPYSVSAFKNTLINGNASFDLFDHFTDKSGEIECLFVERTKQLLNSDYGVCGIVLPISVLEQGNIYTITREFILDHFEIKGIVQFGNNTFMETGTNTISLFLKRVENRSKTILENIEKSISQQKDNSINGIEKPITKFLDQSYKISFNEYVKIFNNAGSGNERLNNIEVYKEYINNFKEQSEDDSIIEHIKNIEFDKIKTFILTYEKQVVIANAPKNKDEEKDFLGFSFSKRRGSEGISISNLGGSLYNPEDVSDRTKVNWYILQNFLGEEINEIHPEADAVQVSSLHEYIDFGSTNFKRKCFEKVINLSKEYKVSFGSKYETEKLKGLISENKKSDIQVNQVVQGVGKYPFFTSGEEVLTHKDFLVDGKNIFLSTGGNACIHYRNGKAAYSTDTWSISSNDENRIKTETLFSLLALKIKDIGRYYFKGKGLKHIQKPDFLEMEIPMIPKNIQNLIIRDTEKVKNEEEKLQQENIKILQEINGLFQLNDPKVKLRDVCEISRGGSPRPIQNYKTRKEGGVPWVMIGDAKDAYKHIEETKEFIINDGVQRSRMVKSGDLIMSNSMTVGKPFVLRIDGCIHDGWLLLKPDNDKLGKEFLFYLLNTPENQDKLRKQARGSVVKNLNIDRVGDFKIPIPELKKQREILSKVNKIEPTLIKNRKRLEKIDQRFLQIFEKYL